MWTLNIYTFVILYRNLKNFLSEETPLQLIEVYPVEPKNGDKVVFALYMEYFRVSLIASGFIHSFYFSCTLVKNLQQRFFVL